MKNDLISRQKLLEELNGLEPEGFGKSIAGMVAIRKIQEAPSVDAAPVVHGEWSTIEDDYTGMIALQCSECNQEYWFEDEPPLKLYNHCPNCGALMDGGDGR